MFILSKGLENSLIVLEHLRNMEEIKDINISVGCFTNCRECGLTFRYVGRKSFTWCVYEHRNSDTIIINGKEGFISICGELPYKGDSKYVYLAEFSYDQHYECAVELKNMIVKFNEKNKYNSEKGGR